MAFQLYFISLLRSKHLFCHVGLQPGNLPYIKTLFSLKACLFTSKSVSWAGGCGQLKVWCTQQRKWNGRGLGSFLEASDLWIPEWYWLLCTSLRGYWSQQCRIQRLALLQCRVLIHQQQLDSLECQRHWLANWALGSNTALKVLWVQVRFAAQFSNHDKVLRLCFTLSLSLFMPPSVLHVV